MKLAAILITLYSLANADQGYCPSIECLEKPREDLLCFKHSATNPVDKITFYPCPSNHICDIDYT